MDLETRSVRRYPTNPRARYRKAQALREIGNTEFAVKELKYILRKCYMEATPLEVKCTRRLLKQYKKEMRKHKARHHPNPPR